jgi:erythromycin esterase
MRRAAHHVSLVSLVFFLASSSQFVASDAHRVHVDEKPETVSSSLEVPFLHLSELPPVAAPPLVPEAKSATAGNWVYAIPWLSLDRPSRTEIRVFNPDVGTVEFHVAAYDMAGSRLDERSMAALPGQVVVLDEWSEDNRTSWLKITASGRLAGSCTLYDDSGGRATMALTPVNLGSSLIVPHVVGEGHQANRELPHRLTVVNTDAETSFRIVPRDKNGCDLSQRLAGDFAGAIRLAPGARFSADYAELVAGHVDDVAWIEIESGGRLAGAVMFGRSGGDFATILAQPGAGLEGERALFLNLGEEVYRTFDLFNPSSQPITVRVGLWTEGGGPILEESYSVDPKASLQGLVGRGGVQIPFDSSKPGIGPRRGIKLPGRHGRQVGTVRLQADGPFVVTRVDQRDRGALEGFVPTVPSNYLGLALPDGEDDCQLLLHSGEAGEAVVSVHSPAGNEILRRTVNFEAPGVTTIRMTALEPDSYVSVSSGPGGIAIAGLLEEIDGGGAVARIPAADATPSQVLPSGNALNSRLDPWAIPLRPLWNTYVKDNHHVLASIHSDNFEDLQFLKDLIGDKRIVQLGESGHGVAEFDSVKVRLIKFLHQQMGFDVIAFESGLFECEWTRRMDPGAYNSFWHMYSSIFGVWHAYETLELFNYIRQSKLTSRPLILAGFDPQFSSFLGLQNQPGFLRGVLEPVDADYAAAVYEVETEYVENWLLPEFTLANKDRLDEFYADALEFVTEHRSAIETSWPDDPNVADLLVAILRNNLTRLELEWIFATEPYSLDYTLVRDRAMADNVDYLADVLYPDKKIITWAHNYHIRYDQPNVQADDGAMTMGYYIGQRRREEVYTVGLQMYRGRAAWNNRQLYTLRSPNREQSLEAIGYAAGRKFAVLDMLWAQPGPGSTMGAGNAWMDQWIDTWSWGFAGPIRMIPRNNYDALLFVNTVHPPSYTY